jgi:hypothetical protein
MEDTLERFPSGSLLGDLLGAGYLRSGAFPAIRADNPAAEAPARPFLSS